MLRAATRAPNLLLEAGDSVVEFLRGQLNEDGGARDRSGASDLYYTLFALEGLAAMDADPPTEPVLPFLHNFGDGTGNGRPDEALDFVHQACLARCWANMPPGVLDTDIARRILQRMESHRSPDGGYGTCAGAGSGSVYNSFLALGAYQDLHEELPKRERLVDCLAGLQTGDGAYANEHGLKLGTTPATAAAATLLQELDVPVPSPVGEWLIARCDDKGGFLATPNAPFPDLLSTATALHALAMMGVSLEKIKEACLDFVDSLWTGHAFRGHWADDVADCEYTYYALLALGHLSS